VARYADANNIGGTVESMREKEAILLRHCEDVGRDPAEIERTTGRGVLVIRDSEAEAKRVFADMFERNGKARHWQDQPVGTPEQIVERLEPVIELGYRHVEFGFPSPYDQESMERFIREVKPRLVERFGTTGAVPGGTADKSLVSGAA
jgi:alkanesulfonate monooxygenase SsuD/methylene tetrahydromethanopterin reductase-like flavin-dependent oxidoreductase (luciferase family)